MPNEYVNKVIYGGKTLIDLTSDDVKASDVLSGKIFHLPSGQSATGTCTYDANTKDATAVASEILSGRTAYKNGSKLTGTMTNNGSITRTIDEVAQKITIPNGYHDGSGYVQIDSTEQTKIVPNNIRQGVSILGVVGTMSGSESVKATNVSVTPYTVAQTIMPADLGDYNYIAQVTVAAIAYSEMDNAAGGKTVTIGTVKPA